MMRAHEYDNMVKGAVGHMKATLHPGGSPHAWSKPPNRLPLKLVAAQADQLPAAVSEWFAPAAAGGYDWSQQPLLQLC